MLRVPKWKYSATVCEQDVVAQLQLARFVIDDLDPFVHQGMGSAFVGTVRNMKGRPPKSNLE